MEEVHGLEKEALFTKRDFKLANPDGSAEERTVFAAGVAKVFPAAVRFLRMKNCVRRILAVDPLAAVTPVVCPLPPPKRVSTADAANAAKKARTSGSSSSGSSSSVKPAGAGGSTSSSNAPAAVKNSGKTPVKASVDSASKSAFKSAPKSLVVYDNDDDVVVEDGSEISPGCSKDADDEMSNHKDLPSLFNDVADEVRSVEMSFNFPLFGYPCLSLPNPLPLLRLPLRMTLRGWSFIYCQPCRIIIDFTD